MTDERELHATYCDAFLRRLAEDAPAPPGASDQWLMIQLRLDAERRQRALRPLRWIRTLALIATAVVALAMLLMTPQKGFFAPLLQALESAARSTGWLFDVRALLVLALVIAALVLWREGEAWVET